MFTYLVPQRSCHLVYERPELSILSRIADVGPGAQSDESESQHHVTHAGDHVHAHKAGDPRRHVHDEDDYEERGGCPCRMEDVFGVVVLDVLHEELVDLGLQLLQVPATELFAAHLLHATEHSQRLGTDLCVTGLQLARGQKRTVTSTYLLEEMSESENEY